MSRHGPAILLALIALLSAAAALMLGLGPAEPGPRAPAFQRLVGGLGFGPAVAPDGCTFNFDPRLCPRCGREHGPIPGGADFCPAHAVSVFAYPPLPPAGATRAE